MHIFTWLTFMKKKAGVLSSFLHPNTTCDYKLRAGMMADLWKIHIFHLWQIWWNQETSKSNKNTPWFWYYKSLFSTQPVILPQAVTVADVSVTNYWYQRQNTQNEHVLISTVSIEHCAHTQCRQFSHVYWNQTLSALKPEILGDVPLIISRETKER